VEASFPQEYAALRTVNELATWILQKRHSIPYFDVGYNNVSQSEMVKILQVLDDADMWNRSLDYDLKEEDEQGPLSRLKSQLSDTCQLLFLDECQGFEFFEPSFWTSTFTISWNNHFVIGNNSAPLWFKVD